MECPDRGTWGLAASSIVLWLLVGMTPMFSKCLMTTTACTRWGPSGGDFGNPLTTTFYQLALVALSLLPTIVKLDKPLEVFRACVPVGICFGVKYSVSHLALQKTPASMYALLHASTIVFIVIFSRLILGEKLESKLEVFAFLGVVAGTILSTLQEISAVGVLPLMLTLLDCVLAGVLVSLLRKAMVHVKKHALQVTCFKSLVGAVVVCPVALFLEGPQAVSRSQMNLLLLSSATILGYHANLSILCWLAPALVVGVVESMKGIPAFTMTSLMQGIPHTTVAFWCGALIVLASAFLFKLARALNDRAKRRPLDPDELSPVVALSTPLVPNDEPDDVTKAPVVTTFSV